MQIKIKSIRNFLFRNKIYGYLITKNDEYFKQPDNLNLDILRKLTDFTGSFGIAIITQDQNYLFVDGRYTTQAQKESGRKFKIIKIDLLKKFIDNKFKKNKNIAYDDRFFQLNFINRFYKGKSNFVPHPFSLPNLKNSNKTEVFEFDKKYHGLNFDKKFKKIKNLIKLNNDEALLISSSENICWLSNLRSKNVYNPIIKSKAILKKNQLFIYCNIKNIKKSSRINKKIRLLDENKIFSDIKYFKKIYLDQNTVSVNFVNKLKKMQVLIKTIEDPIYFLKSIKNKVEIKNLIKAQIYDGVALIKLMFWIKNNINKRKISEIDVQNKLEIIKNSNKNYISPSFETISAFGANGALIHYNAKNVKKKTFLKKNNFYLLDSGSQYYNGTTDVTRTIKLGKISKFQKNIYTYVLKSHIAVNNYKLTDKTTGHNVDIEARFLMKKMAKNYNHGTGHGIGFFLNVHENPPNISLNSKSKFYEGQVMSNEPGYYKVNHFGIRLENMMIVKKEKGKKFFDNLTLVPFDKNSLNNNLLSKSEIQWINNYHKKVFKKLNEFLPLKERKYLQNLCSKI